MTESHPLRDTAGGRGLAGRCWSIDGNYHVIKQPSVFVTDQGTLKKRPNIDGDGPERKEINQETGGRIGGPDI